MVSLQVAKLTVKLREPAMVVESVHNKLVDTYGQEQKGGGVLVITPNDPQGRPTSPDWEKFSCERDKLMAQTVELDIEKIKLPTRVNGESLQIEPSLLMALEKFIDIVEA